ncbi:MAG: hypothetical protein ACO3SP_04055, partial [Ilumatobacteraceae bacterium]
MVRIEPDGPHDRGRERGELILELGGLITDLEPLGEHLRHLRAELVAQEAGVDVERPDTIGREAGD